MTTPGECYGCVRTDVPLRRRVIRTHAARPEFEVNMCDRCMSDFDRSISALMKKHETFARRLAEGAGRMGGEPDAD